VRRLALLLAGAAILSGCGARDEAVTTAPSETLPVPVKPQPQPQPRPREPDVRLRRVQVTVVDGDTNARVSGARVTIGRHTGRTNASGVARIPLVHRAALVTTAAKPGYDTRSVRLAYQRRPKSTIRIYRRALQWTMYGATPQRVQAHQAIRIRPPFRVVWSRGLGSLIEFPAVVADGVAYIANARGTIRALSMRDGTVIWRHDTPDGKMASSPAIVGDELVAHGMDGHVWVLRRSDGRLLWHYTVGSPIESSPVVVHGVDLFGAWNGTVTALDLRMHRVLWRRYDGCKITSSLAVLGPTVYLGDYCGRVRALRLADGALRWSASVGGRVYGTPAVADGRVFVPSSTAGTLTAFTTGGRELWRRSTGGYVYSSPAVSDGRVFFGSYDGTFYALSARTGATLWTRWTGGPISGAAVVVDGVAYAGSFAHRIVGVDVRTGKLLVDFPHGDYVPVSGSGKRLLLHGYSRVYAVAAAR
jgi:outer membrane protein assembly factor BamB